MASHWLRAKLRCWLFHRSEIDTNLNYTYSVDSYSLYRAVHTHTVPGLKHPVSECWKQVNVTLHRAKDKVEVLLRSFWTSALGSAKPQPHNPPVGSCHESACSPVTVPTELPRLRLNVVQGNNGGLFWDPHRNNKYSLCGQNVELLSARIVTARLYVRQNVPQTVSQRCYVSMPVT